MARSLVALGFMSGTSLDGIDAAIIETDGEKIFKFGPTYSHGYDKEQRDLLTRAIKAARHLQDRYARPGILPEAEDFITQAHADVAAEFMKNEGLLPQHIDIIGFHGQTVFHKPEDGLTVQIGDGAQLAALTGIDVVGDFRAADMIAGGQGAPLAPVYHQALQHYSGTTQTSVCVNIGGISNITWVSPGCDLIAFDTGPGNVLLDAWAQQYLNQPFDRDGEFALSGTVCPSVLEKLLANTYFELAPPKSLDKTYFELGGVAELRPQDAAATLAAFTAETIARSQNHMPEPPEKWIICGGGRLNQAIMQELQHRLSAPVISAEDAGFRGDDIEAQAFAYLAVRALKGLPLTFPKTTGVPAPTRGGLIHRADPARGLAAV